MLNQITTINAGFSIVAAMILFLVYVLFLRNVNKSWLAVASCAALLVGLCILQLYHLQALGSSLSPLESPIYLFWLFLTPPAFYYFSHAILFPDQRFGAWQLLHVAPMLLPWLIPRDIALPIIFLIGLAYSLWLTNIIYGLRSSRDKSTLELFFFGLFSIIAVLVLLVVLAMPHIDPQLFYLFYANSIAIAFVLIVGALLAFPHLLSELAEAARLKYSASTLGTIDKDEVCRQLERLMQNEQIYQNEDVSLTTVADGLSLTGHQLSELVNSVYRISFSQYIRQQRIKQAKILLLKDARASILAISMEVGFKSQSNFYAAFKDITGQSPGTFRKTSQES